MAEEHSTLLIAMGIHRLLQIIQVNLKIVVYTFSALLAPIFAAIYVILCISREVKVTMLFKISCLRVQMI